MTPSKIQNDILFFSRSQRLKSPVRRLKNSWRNRGRKMPRRLWMHLLRDATDWVWQTTMMMMMMIWMMM
jgi:hypothetical protein